MIVHVGPLLAVLFGVLILLFPRFLNYLVAAYLMSADSLASEWSRCAEVVTCLTERVETETENVRPLVRSAASVVDKSRDCRTR
jgi:hypothetical protein